MTELTAFYQRFQRKADNTRGKALENTKRSKDTTMNIGILGYGTIGRGVAALVKELPAEYGIKTVKILDLPQKKEELGALYAATKEEICLSPQIDTVIEVLGGNDFAYECIKMALNNGKNVVTSNKEVVSRHIEEFYSLARAHGVYVRGYC